MIKLFQQQQCSRSLFRYMYYLGSGMAFAKVIDIPSDESYKEDSLLAL